MPPDRAVGIVIDICSCAVMRSAGLVTVLLYISFLTLVVTGKYILRPFKFLVQGADPGWGVTWGCKPPFYQQNRVKTRVRACGERTTSSPNRPFPKCLIRPGFPSLFPT